MRDNLIEEFAELREFASDNELEHIVSEIDCAYIYKCDCIHIDDVEDKRFKLGIMISLFKTCYDLITRIIEKYFEDKKFNSIRHISGEAAEYKRAIDKLTNIAIDNKFEELYQLQVKVPKKESVECDCGGGGCTHFIEYENKEETKDIEK